MAQDFLKECMSDPALVQGQVPMDEFNRAFCIRCVQKECSRAGLNGSLFARRTATWKENLFDKPPRADEADPKYQGIRSKRFLQVSTDVVELRKNGVNYEVQTREMPEIPAALRKDTPEPPALDPTPPPPAPIPEPPTPVPVPELTVQPQAVPDAPPPVHNAPFQNTPFDQGTVLPGGQPAEQVTEVGGSYVFGSDE